jgi:hypothetical protein
VLDHDFREASHLSEANVVRFTVPDRVRLEVLRRLAAMNKERYDAEIAQGLQSRRAGSGKAPGRRSRAASASEPTLDLENIHPTTIEGDD